MNADTALRPRRFADYIGQPALLSRLRILTAAAKSRGEPMPHTLLHGPPGLGKTTLANIIAAEMGARAHVVMAPSLEKPQDVTGLLARLAPHDVLFIDEIHRLAPAMAELLYPAMEDGFAVVNIDCKIYTRPVQLELPPFTLIGATTQPGLLEPPLRDRFGIPLALEYYAPADLLTILTANAEKLKMAADPLALQLLAERSRGTPRIANHLLRFARDVATVEAAEGFRSNGHTSHLTLSVARDALRMQGIDSLGLNEADRQYLRVIIQTYKGGPVGAEALAATMGVKADTVSGVIEPWLLMQGFVARTQRGRKSTEKAEKHLAAAAA